MVEALAATASASGIASLGITICGGLINYYSSWVNRDKDVAATYRYINGLADVLEELQLVLERWNFLPELSDRVEGHILACASSLQQLQNEWNKVKSTEDRSSLKSKLADQSRKMMYPFKEKTLSKIQRTTSEMRENLRLALDMLSTDAAAKSYATLHQIEIGSRETQDMIAQNASVVSATAQNLDHMSDDLAGVGNTIMSISDSMITKAEFEEVIEIKTQSLREELHAASGQMASQIQVFARAMTTFYPELTMAMVGCSLDI